MNFWPLFLKEPEIPHTAGPTTPSPKENCNSPSQSPSWPERVWEFPPGGGGRREYRAAKARCAICTACFNNPALFDSSILSLVNASAKKSLKLYHKDVYMCIYDTTRMYRETREWTRGGSSRLEHGWDARPGVPNGGEREDGCRAANPRGNGRWVRGSTFWGTGSMGNGSWKGSRSDRCEIREVGHCVWVGITLVPNRRFVDR